ncbi:MAG: hypothetical protein QW140_02295 [Candidatus Aenigmatarchaeota archaeon]
MKRFIFILFLLISFPICLAQPYLTISFQVSDPFIRPGGETTVFVSLVNPSTKDIGRIRVFAYPGPSLTLSSSYFEISGLNAGSSQQVSLNVKASNSASSQNSYITVNAKYFAESIEKEVTTTIPIVIRADPLLQIENISLSPEPEPGKEVELRFLIFNFGQGSSKDLSVRISQSDAFGVMGENEKFLDEIKPNDFKEVSFSLIIKPSATSGIYSIPIYLTFKDELKSINYSLTKSIDFKISGSYRFLVYLKSQDIITPNSKGNVEIRIVNAGNQEAKYLTLEIIPSHPFYEIFPQQVYVGSLNKDDYDTEKISLKVGNVLSDTYPLKIKISYEDAFGKSFEEEKTVYVKVYSFEEVKRPSLISPFVIILIFFVAVIGYYFWKKRKGK